MPVLHAIEDASVFVIGAIEFLATLRQRISHLATEAIEIENGCYADKAIAIVDRKHPEVLLLQAKLEGSLALCRQIKEKKQFGNIYCILIDWSLD